MFSSNTDIHGFLLIQTFTDSIIKRQKLQSYRNQSIDFLSKLTTGFSMMATFAFNEFNVAMDIAFFVELQTLENESQIWGKGKEGDNRI